MNCMPIVRDIPKGGIWPGEEVTTHTMTEEEWTQGAFDARFRIFARVTRREEPQEHTQKCWDATIKDVVGVGAGPARGHVSLR